MHQECSEFSQRQLIPTLIIIYCMRIIYFVLNLTSIIVAIKNSLRLIGDTSEANVNLFGIYPKRGHEKGSKKHIYEV